jgi:hypothetical protein
MKDPLQFLIQLLAEIPATFWGVVIGSLFTLTGIYLTNRASDRRLRLQLQNDRELKNREREMAFRKDTYAAGVEASSVQVSVLPKISDLSFSLKDISAIAVEKSPALAKVNLVAGEGTLRALTSFGVEFSGAFTRLMQQRMVFAILQEQIAAKIALLSGFEKTRDAMLELMRHHNIDGVQDPRRFEVIQENFDFEAKRIATTSQEIQLMTADLAAKHGPFAKQCFVEFTKVNRMLIPLLVAARSELELPISHELYVEILQQTEPKLEGHLDELIQSIPALAVRAPTTQIHPND